MDMGSSGNISQNAPSGDTAQSSPQGVGGQKPDVSLEGPSAVVSARETQVLALPNVEYGPGMDASVITGDSTGASETSPVPSGQSYVDIIMNAGAQSGVNPYVLGAMILQEQANGTSGSISGTTAGYQGIYNFFNIGAYRRIPCPLSPEACGTRPRQEIMDGPGIPSRSLSWEELFIMERILFPRDRIHFI